MTDETVPARQAKTQWQELRQAIQRKMRLMLPFLNDADLAQYKLATAGSAFSDPEIELDPTKPANFDPDNTDGYRPEDSEEYDVKTEIRLIELECIDLEVERRAREKAGLKLVNDGPGKTSRVIGPKQEC